MIKAKPTARRKPESRSPHAPWLLAILIAALVPLAAGCLPQSNASLSGNFDFSDRFTPAGDPTAPLTDEQKLQLRFYGDGGDDGHDIVSELYWSTIDPNHLRKLRRSECLWVESEGFPILSYEAIVRSFVLTQDSVEVFTTDAASLFGHLDSNYRGGDLTQPWTRETLKLTHDGKSLHTASIVQMLGDAEVAVIRYESSPDQDPMGSCQSIIQADAGERLASRKIFGSGDHFYPEPAVLIRGGLPYLRGDTAYQLQVVNRETLDVIDISDVGDLTSELHTVKPMLKRVVGARSLARPMELSDFQDRPMEDAWTWQVNTDLNGNWEENFSPNLKVSEVRVFAVRDGERVYLSPTFVKGKVNLNTELSCSSAVEDSGEVFFDLVACEELTTPAYRHSYLEGLMREGGVEDQDALRWLLYFPQQDGAGDSENLPRPDDDVFIEFKLIDRTIGTSGSILIGEPPGKDLGKLRVDAPHGFDNAFTVTNGGHASIIIDDVTVSGRDADEFSTRLDASHVPPFPLRAGQSFGVSVDALATGIGQKEAVVEVHGRAGGQSSKIQLVVTAYADEATAWVLPATVAFRKTARTTQTVRNCLLGNNGGWPLRRGDATIVGMHPQAFTIRSSQYNGKTEPLAPFRWIGPGEMEVYQIEYRALTPGVHSAALRIETSAGQRIVQLRGLSDVPLLQNAGAETK